MPDIENFDSEARDAAANALGAAAGDPFAEGYDDPSVEPNQPEPVVEQGEPAVEPVEPTQAATSREIDLSTLPLEAQEFVKARERELTADYTRKTQEVAQQRQEAEQALQFIDALNNDPQFAKQVYDALAESLPQATNYEYDDNSLYLPEEDDPYAQKLAELEQWKTGLEKQFEEAQWNAHIDRQLAEVRSANADWTDDDINDVIGLGFATQGDLHKAADMLSQIKNRVVSSYVEQKSSVQAPALTLPSVSAQVPPEGFTGVEDKRLHDAAMERLRAELG